MLSVLIWMSTTGRNYWLDLLIYSKGSRPNVVTVVVLNYGYIIIFGIINVLLNATVHYQNTACLSHTVNEKCSCRIVGLLIGPDSILFFFSLSAISSVYDEQSYR